VPWQRCFPWGKSYWCDTFLYRARRWCRRASLLFRKIQQQHTTTNNKQQQQQLQQQQQQQQQQTTTTNNNNHNNNNNNYNYNKQQQQPQQPTTTQGDLGPTSLLLSQELWHDRQPFATDYKFIGGWGCESL
jgi:hypothetical protein